MVLCLYVVQCIDLKARWIPYYPTKNRTFRASVRLDVAATALRCNVFRDEGR